MANKSDKRIAAENAAILRLLKAGTVGIHVRVETPEEQELSH